MSKLPATACRRPTTILSTTTATATSLPQRSTQLRHATFIPRPRRPYAFTQLVQLSDGSTYTARTTSPLALYKSAKDSRNHAVWQPSDKSLRNVELDEAGRLAAFRGRYGRGFDLEDGPGEEGHDATAGALASAKKTVGSKGGLDSLGDLISGYATKAEEEAEAERARRTAEAEAAAAAKQGKKK